MTKSCLQFHEWCEEVGMPPDDQRNYLAVAEEIVEVAVKNNAEITAQEIAEMVVECCGGAIADYIDEESAEDKELAKGMVVEEIREVISKRVSIFKSVQALEKMIEKTPSLDAVFYLEIEIANLKRGLNQKVTEKKAEIERMKKEKEKLEDELGKLLQDSSSTFEERELFRKEIEELSFAILKKRLER